MWMKLADTVLVISFFLSLVWLFEAHDMANIGSYIQNAYVRVARSVSEILRMRRGT